MQQRAWLIKLLIFSGRSHRVGVLPLLQDHKSLSLGTATVRRISDMNTIIGFFNPVVAIRGLRLANDNKHRDVPTAEASVVKTIPLSATMEFQRKSRKAVRRTGFAESAVWAVFAVSSAIMILLSLCQIAPASAQPAPPKRCLSVINRTSNPFNHFKRSGRGPTQWGEDDCSG